MLIVSRPWLPPSLHRPTELTLTLTLTLTQAPPSERILSPPGSRRLLLDIHHADVNVQDRYGGTPMIDSVRHKKDTSAFLLRSHGAALKLDDPAGALCSAAAEGDVDEVRDHPHIAH